ncbi:hypothetical protein DBR17_07135, partial [Sphingomonas sp. HMWF008]
IGTWRVVMPGGALTFHFGGLAGVAAGAGVGAVCAESGLAIITAAITAVTSYRIETPAPGSLVILLPHWYAGASHPATAITGDGNVALLA